MRFLKYLFLSILVGFVLGCSSTSRIVKSSTNSSLYKFEKQPNNFYFTVLQLNDVYEIAPIQGGKYGGMPPVESLRKQLLKEDPNTIVVLAGDFLNPSLLGSLKYNGERIKGKQMVEVMNAMNFDLVAFGNHEFDLSYSQLQERLNESDFDWISSNVFHNQEGKSHYFYKIKNGKREDTFDTYVKKLYNGKKTLDVGFISVCIPSNPKDYVTYTDVFIEAERSYNEVSNNSDIVLGLTHLEIGQDKKVASLLPNIPLIMGGHEHTNSYNTVGNVKIAKADANAKTVYIHRFEYNPTTKQTKVKSELFTIDNSLPEDPTVAAIVTKWQNILESKVKNVVPTPNEVIYHAKDPLEGRDTPIRSMQTNLGQLITKSMSHAFNDTVDCALVNGGSIRIDDQLKGNITPIDVFRVLPYGGAVLKTEIKGSLLKKVLDFGVDARGSGAYLQRFNVTRSSGNWLVKGQAINDNRTYVVAFSDYLLKGYDIPFLKHSNPGVVSVYKPVSSELGFDIRKAIISYLKQ